MDQASSCSKDRNIELGTPTEDVIDVGTWGEAP
jgi:hypothetical protein